MKKANIIGSGPNGLAAAIVLAQSGLQVEVFEAESQPGGATRTMALTLPGYQHDFGSAVHPMAAGSPFFGQLPLEESGLHWIHGDAPLAHPLDDGSAILLERSLQETVRDFGIDGSAWNNLVSPLASRWRDFAQDGLQSPLHLPSHPWLMARFGFAALQPAQRVAHRFQTPRVRALFAGIAAHSMLGFNHWMSSAVGIVLGAVAHAVGWPVPRGGAQSISDALIHQLQQLGGTVHTGHRILSLDAFDGETSLILCDVTPRQLLAIGGDRLSTRYRRTLSRFQYGPGAFKIDYALSEPVPWKAEDCRRAITVHLGGSFEEIAESEHIVEQGGHPERPFVLAAQPSLFDPLRAPEGRHTLWLYCHVPNGSTVDMTAHIESQIERFAPGFRDCILARHVSSPASLEAQDANLVGGDINGGYFSFRQTFLRPGLRRYATSAPNLYLCSASTPPGGGVHGMCGYHAAKTALRHLNLS